MRGNLKLTVVGFALSGFLAGFGAAPATAAVKAGASCPKVGKVQVVAGKPLACTKVRGRLVWVAKPSGVKPSTTPPITPTPPPLTPTPPPLAPLQWMTPTSALEISTAAYKSFTEYMATVRNPKAEITTIAQDGADPIWKTWIDATAVPVARAFDYPPLTKPFVDVLAFDRDWLRTTYIGLGFSDAAVRDRLGGFDAGAPAFGGAETNTWNLTTIKNSNALVDNRVGMSQVAGHEFFHAVQERLAGRLATADGEKVPNWFWEGPAQLVGLMSTSWAGINDFQTASRKQMLNRYNNGPRETRVLLLRDVKANLPPNIDPYAIGYAGAEYLVASMGMERFVDVYRQLGKGKAFPDAFLAATGQSLDSFYTAFEAARTTLGFPRA